MTLEELERIVENKTPGPWKLAKEKFLIEEYSSVDLGDEDNNGSARIKHLYGKEWENACFIATFGTLADKIMAVLNEASKLESYATDNNVAVYASDTDIVHKFRELKEAMEKL